MALSFVFSSSSPLVSQVHNQRCRVSGVAATGSQNRKAKNSKLLCFFFLNKMWDVKDALWSCISPAKIISDSVKILPTNKLVFSCILCFTTLPLSFLTFKFTLSTHTLRTRIYHLEALALLAPTRVEARHAWHESRDDAVSLIRTRALYSLLCFPLSLAAAVSAVHTATSAINGRPATVKSAAAAVRQTWKRASATAVVAYAILLAYALVPRVLANPMASPGSQLLVLAVGWGAEVYLMAVLGMGLVVSVAEERFGWEAIRIGSGLMEGRRFCGWVLSGLFVLVSGLINRRVEMLLEGRDSAEGILSSSSAAAVISVRDMMGLVCSYGLVVLLSYVITAVFYCDGKRRAT